MPPPISILDFEGLLGPIFCEVDGADWTGSMVGVACGLSVEVIGDSLLGEEFPTGSSTNNKPTTKKSGRANKILFIQLRIRRYFKN